MPLSKAMNAKLNEQITNEFYSSQVYLGMASMFENMSLKVLAAFFFKQAEEEREHGMKFVKYIPEVEGEVQLHPIPAPPPKYNSVLAAIEAALAHERKVTQQIHDLVALAETEKDYATRAFLQWFVTEQVEEVDTQIQLAQAARIAGERLLQLEAYVAQSGLLK
ncbi:MAG: ferritin [Planctomycetota bacterium]